MTVNIMTTMKMIPMKMTFTGNDTYTNDSYENNDN